MNTDELKRCAGVVVGVSGGSDSMALLDMLFQKKIPLAAAHVNHSLRPQADSEQRMVEAYCKRHKIPCYSMKADVGADCPAGMSVEEYARNVRYTFFEKLCAQLGYTHIATAHHADDNTETFFLNLLRGCGTATAIPARRVTQTGHIIVRPLLDMKKEELIKYCQARSIPYCTDQTNFESFCKRNALRNEILPQLRRLNPGLDETVARFIRLSARDDAYLSKQAVKLLRENGLNCTALSAAEPALATRAIRAAVKEQTGLILSEAVTENILKLLHSRSGAKIDIGGGHFIQRVYGALQIDAQETAIAPQRLQPGQNELPCGVLTLTRVRSGADISDAFAQDLYVRSKQPGDTVKLNRRGTKTLKKLFSDAKIPVSKRAQIPVILNRNAIVFICGFGAAQGVSGGEGYKIAYFEKK